MFSSSNRSNLFYNPPGKRTENDTPSDHTNRIIKSLSDNYLYFDFIFTNCPIFKQKSFTVLNLNRAKNSNKITWLFLTFRRDNLEFHLREYLLASTTRAFDEIIWNFL
jgi:hypothetical protein